MIMSSTGILKIYNNGNYIDTLVQKREQGFIPYETNSSIREYSEFKSMFKPIIGLRKHEHVIFSTRWITVDTNHKLRFKSMLTDIIKYAEQEVFLLSLEIEEPLSYSLIRNGERGYFMVSGEFLLNEKVISFTMRMNDFTQINPELTEIKELWENVLYTKQLLEQGKWVPLILPSRENLENTEKQFNNN